VRPRGRYYSGGNQKEVCSVAILPALVRDTLGSFPVFVSVHATQQPDWCNFAVREKNSFPYVVHSGSPSGKMGCDH